jgi:AcrR family transcriptional regulator
MATPDRTRPARRLDQRRARERDIVDAARALFDERGIQDAPMDEIARVVGINRALIYRHFESKEELFVLTVTSYLAEITAQARQRIDRTAEPEQQFRSSWESFTSYCLEHPAFLDCALSLMRRPAGELRERVSDATWFRLGLSMSESLEVTTEILTSGKAKGVFTIDDPAFTTNCLYTQTLGMMHMARIGVIVSQASPGVPRVTTIAADEVQAACLRNALAAIGITNPS